MATPAELIETRNGTALDRALTNSTVVLAVPALRIETIRAPNPQPLTDALLGVGRFPSELITASCGNYFLVETRQLGAAFESANQERAQPHESILIFSAVRGEAPPPRERDALRALILHRGGCSIN